MGQCGQMKDVLKSTWYVLKWSRGSVEKIREELRQRDAAKKAQGRCPVHGCDTELTANYDQCDCHWIQGEFVKDYDDVWRHQVLFLIMCTALFFTVAFIAVHVVPMFFQEMSLK